MLSARQKFILQKLNLSKIESVLDRQQRSSPDPAAARSSTNSNSQLISQLKQNWQIYKQKLLVTPELIANSTTNVSTKPRVKTNSITLSNKSKLTDLIPPLASSLSSFNWKIQPKIKFCDYYQIKQCEGICGGLEALSSYQVKIEQITAILSGKTKIVQKHCQQKIDQAIDHQNFALAALWRDRLAHLAVSIGQQQVVLPGQENLDLLSLIVETDQDLVLGSIFVQNIREGRVINVVNYLLTASFEAETKIEIAMSFWKRFLLGYTTAAADLVPIILQTDWLESKLN